jgi:uncharacterized protein (DUF1919 family)
MPGPPASATISHKSGWHSRQDQLEIHRLKSVLLKPRDAALGTPISRLASLPFANREIGVPRFRNAAMSAVYFAGGGVTSAVIFRIMPSDLLKT